MRQLVLKKGISILLTLIMVLGLVPITVWAEGSHRVDFCLTNGMLESNVFFENNPGKYFISQITKSDGTLSYLEELYRTDSLDLEFDGWYTEEGERVTTETVFDGYTILYDRWKPTTLTSNEIISSLEIQSPLLEAGKTAGSYDVESVTLTDSRLTVVDVSVYEGLNAYRTNVLEEADVLEKGKSYSLKVELHAQNGCYVNDQLSSNCSATYGLVSNMLYSHDNSGIFTTQWTNRENKIQVVLNYDFENYYFTSEMPDQVVENNQSPIATIYVSKAEEIASAKLLVSDALGNWMSLGEVTGQFAIPANSNVVKQYRVEVIYQNGFVISSNVFRVDWYDPDAPKFIAQPTDQNVAYGTNFYVNWTLNFDPSSIQLERFQGESWEYVQLATPTGTNVTAFAEAGTYTFRAHATKNGVDYYSDPFTITWREKFEFTVQPQSIKVATGEPYSITWDTNQTPAILQLWTNGGDGWHRMANIDSSAKSYNFEASMFGFSQEYKLMANYDNVEYYSDAFTIEIVAGEFTTQPPATVTAFINKDCIVEWDFNLDAAYYDILYYDNDFVPYERVYQPEHNFKESNEGRKQFLIQAYNAKDVMIGQSDLFEITWVDQSVVYLVSFFANGGGGTMLPLEKNAGSQYTLPSCTFTAPAGKRFKGWKVNGVAKAVGDSITINANTVIAADWEDNEVIYLYNANGAEGSNEIGYATVGEEIILDDCLFTPPPGCQFKAWAIGSLSGEQKQPGEKITITGETYIYAIWERYEMQVEFGWSNDGCTVEAFSFETGVTIKAAVYQKKILKGIVELTPENPMTDLPGDTVKVFFWDENLRPVYAPKISTKP